jgi:hypothetical protein
MPRTGSQSLGGFREHPVAKVRVSTRFDITKAVDGLITQDFVDEMGSTIKQGMLDAMAAGKSPVAGEGNFEPYADPKKYPGGRKPARPVNLKLTGRLWEAIRWYRNRDSVVIGIADPEVAKYAEAHNEGLGHMPKRQFLPGPGEVFLPAILDKALALYRKSLSAIINKTNSR